MMIPKILEKLIIAFFPLVIFIALDAKYKMSGFYEQITGRSSRGQAVFLASGVMIFIVLDVLQLKYLEPISIFLIFLYVTNRTGWKVIKKNTRNRAVEKKR